MPLPTVYFYNKNKYQVTVVGKDNKIYYLMPKNHTYLQVELHENQLLPSGVQRLNTPLEWNESMWPWKNPWDMQ